MIGFYPSYYSYPYDTLPYYSYPYSSYYTVPSSYYLSDNGYYDDSYCPQCAAANSTAYQSYYYSPEYSDEPVVEEAGITEEVASNKSSAPRAQAEDATEDAPGDLRDDVEAEGDRARTRESSATFPNVHPLMHRAEVSRPLIPTAEAPEALPPGPE